MSLQADVKHSQISSPLMRGFSSFKHPSQAISFLPFNQSLPGPICILLGTSQAYMKQDLDGAVCVEDCKCTAVHRLLVSLWGLKKGPFLERDAMQERLEALQSWPSATGWRVQF